MAGSVVNGADPGKVISPEPKNRFEADDDSSKVSRDFFWDQIIKFASSGMLLIAALDIVTSLNSDPVKCHGPDRFTRDQSAFMNGYCSEKTPKVDYFLFFIIGQAIALVGPHFLWSSWFSGNLIHFTSIALSLERHRENDTGEYPHNNFVRIKSLKSSFCKSTAIHRVYFAKILLQLIITIGACLCAGAAFYEFDRPNIFDPVFDCDFTGPHTNFIDFEDYVFNVTCIVPALRSHYAVWITNFILLGVDLVCVCFALLWWVIPQRFLNWKRAALFSLQSGIEPLHYTRRWSCLFRIRTDLDFLLLRLYDQDEGLGKVLREILIILDTREFLHQAKEALNLMKTSGRESQLASFTSSPLIPCKPIPSEELEVEENKYKKTGDSLGAFLLLIMRSSNYGFSEDDENNLTAVVLTFGTEGYSIALAGMSEMVASLKFDRYYLNDEQSSVHHAFNSGIHTIRTRSDIYAKPIEVSQQFSTAFTRHCLKKNQDSGMRTIKLFVVGPFSDPDRVMTIHWFLFYLKGPKIIDKEAKLIVIRPLKIGRTDVRDKFQDFQPLWPWGKEDVNEEKEDVNEEKEDVNEEKEDVNEEKEEDYKEGYFKQGEASFTCGGTRCTFSISVYKVYKNALG